MSKILRKIFNYKNKIFNYSCSKGYASLILNFSKYISEVSTIKVILAIVSIKLLIILKIKSIYFLSQRYMKFNHMYFSISLDDLLTFYGVVNLIKTLALHCQYKF